MFALTRLTRFVSCAVLGVGLCTFVFAGQFVDFVQEQPAAKAGTKDAAGTPTKPDAGGAQGPTVVPEQKPGGC